MSVRLTLGAVLIALGALFLLDSADVVRAGSVLASWWPVVFVLLGAAQAFEQRRVGVGPSILIGAGLVLLAVTTDLVPFGFGTVWPLLLIAAGLWLIVRRDPWRRRSGDTTTDARIDVTAVLGDRRLRSRSRAFEGAAVTTVFGDVDLDLREAEARDGAAVLDLTVVFGDVDVFLPPSWGVTVSATSLFGDITQPGPAGSPPEATTDLSVRGFILFGDLKLHQ